LAKVLILHWRKDKNTSYSKRMARSLVQSVKLYR